MSEVTAIEVAEALANVRQSYAEQQAEQKERMTKLATEICRTLTDYGIPAVWSEFDSSGDSGEVSQASLQRYEQAKTYQRSAYDGTPNYTVPMVPVVDDKGEPVMHLENAGVGENYQPQPVIQENEFPLPDEGQPLPDFTKEMEEGLLEKMRDLTYAVLDSERGGWENNDGAYGEMTLLANGRITCDLNERVMDVADNSFELFQDGLRLDGEMPA